MVKYSSSAKLAARRDARSRRKEYLSSFAMSKKPRKKAVARKRLKKTPEEKKRDAQRRDEASRKYTAALETARDRVTEEAQLLHDTFGGHSAAYYEREILQRPKLSAPQRKTSTWNAWQRAELNMLNSKLPPGAKKYTATHPAFRERAQTKWASMSRAEKAAAAEGPLKELEELKELRGTTKHSVSISAFHDVRSTLRNMHEEAKRLKVRTGAEIAMVVVRGDRDHFPAPSVFTTSELIDQFFHLAYNSTLDEFAWRLEAWVLSGLYGVLKRREDALQELQARASALITQKLGEITDQKAKKMYYSNFPAKITLKYQIVIVNWPLRELVAPSSLRATTELKLLINAWNTNVTRFRKLSTPEYNTWKVQWTTAKAKNANGTANDDEDDEDDEDENGGTPQSDSAQPQSRPVNPVTATDGTAVAVSETGPRKRRSDFQGTHKSKKRRTTDENPTAASASEIPAIPTPPPSAIPQVPSPALAPPRSFSRPPSQSPAPMRLPSMPPPSFLLPPPSSPAPMPPPPPPFLMPSPMTPGPASMPPPFLTMPPPLSPASRPHSVPVSPRLPIFSVPPSPHLPASNIPPSPRIPISGAPSPYLTPSRTPSAMLRVPTPTAANSAVFPMQDSSIASPRFQNAPLGLAMNGMETRWAEEQDASTARPSSSSGLPFSFGLGLGPSSSGSQGFAAAMATIPDPLMLAVSGVSRPTTPAGAYMLPPTALAPPTSPFQFTQEELDILNSSVAYDSPAFTQLSSPMPPYSPFPPASMRPPFSSQMGAINMAGPSSYPTPSSSRVPSNGTSTSWVQEDTLPKPKPKPRAVKKNKGAAPVAGPSSQPL